MSPLLPPQRLPATVPLLSLALAGCFGNEVTPFPPGLEPLEAINKAPAPKPLEGDPYPETIRWVGSSTEAYEWVHAKAFVHAPIARTWQALQQTDVDVDRRAVSEWSMTPDVEEGFDVSYKIHNIVHEFLTVEFDITWRHGVIDGSRDEPEVVAIRFQKTWGTTFIEILRGSIVLRRVDDNTTSLEMIEHINAAMSGEDKISNYVRDLHASTVAWVHDRPLPTY